MNTTRPKRSLVLDRTKWKIGESSVNLLVLAIRTRHSQVPLMGTVLGHAGNSSERDRIALMARHCAIFGAQSTELLLADREFAGSDWFNRLNRNNSPFDIRVAGNRLITRADGRQVKLATMVTLPRKGRHGIGKPERMDRPLHFFTRLPRGDGAEWVIVATNRQRHDALKTCRKRWAIERVRPAH